MREVKRVTFTVGEMIEILQSFPRTMRLDVDCEGCSQTTVFESFGQVWLGISTEESESAL